MFDKEKCGDGITKRYFKDTKLPAWRSSWKVNADQLSSKKFTRKVRTKDVKPGDIIRLLAGKHIAFVVKVNASTIIYAHCSNYSRGKGGHLEKISIRDWEKDLEFQDWRELTGNGDNYRDATYFPALGDSIRRPKWWK